MTTPRSTPSPSTAISAPSRPSDSEERSSVSGRSSSTRQRAGLVGVEHRADGQPALAAVERRLHPLLAGDADEVAVLVDDREPGPPVAQEELVERLADRRGAGIATGWRSMMSATRTPSIRSVSAVWMSAPRADWPSRNAIAISHRPPKLPYASNSQIPTPARQHREALSELGRDSRAACLVAGRPARSIARAIRPPSSGNAGTRLKTEQQHVPSAAAS